MDRQSRRKPWLSAIALAALIACSPQVPDSAQQGGASAAAVVASDVALPAATVASPTRSAGIPLAITKLVNRYTQCMHFAGEINGDQSEADRMVKATMDELGCGTVEDEMARAKARYQDQPAILHVLKAVEE
ncbi:hypothetical protein [Andreprevotia sp. IGB-42]|uniref:hypothetical protein n=1 Tax=Andreprevotia sp. IGB-42 TaxID=2497473 RepID=UPI001357DB3E|nr:hypothetical protein [Andreprevotia sp. IGB-42]